MRQKSNLKVKIKNKLNDIAFKIPYIFIILLMVVISPLGVYFFTTVVKKNKIRIYNRGKNLMSIGFFILFLICVGIYSKVKEIIELFSSGMSLDMINFIPDNIGLYIVGIIIVCSYICGGRNLLKRANIEQKYTRVINREHKEKLVDISKDLDISVTKVKENIKLLQKSEYLIPIEIDNKNDKIIYDKTKINSRIIIDTKNNKRVKCTKCGALIKFKPEEYLECDICGHGMIDEDIK